MVRYLNPSLTNARQAARLRAECLASGSAVLKDAAQLLAPGRWQGLAARPAIVAELCALLEEESERLAHEQDTRVEYPST